MEIIKYHRKGFRRPIGVAIAEINEDGKICIGWSLCDKDDKFTKEIAKSMARQRLYSGVYHFDSRDYSISGNIPRSLTKEVFWVAKRCLYKFRKQDGV